MLLFYTITITTIIIFYYYYYIPIRNGLKRGDALLPLLFNFALEYAIKRVQVKPGWLEIKWYASASGLCR